MDLYDYDESIRKGRFTVIAGVDEAGRGPLAGPVVAAAVILSDKIRINGIRDSKKVPSKEREVLFKKIVLYSRAVGVGITEVGEIEQVNILQATKLAMRKAVTDLREKPDILLIDAGFIHLLVVVIVLINFLLLHRLNNRTSRRPLLLGLRYKLLRSRLRSIRFNGQVSHLVWYPGPDRAAGADGRRNSAYGRCRRSVAPSHSRRHRRWRNSGKRRPSRPCRGP